jgi:hypothetical protein
MLHYAFRASGRMLPRNKELLDAAATFAPEIASLARRFFETAEVTERLNLAGSIADRTIQVRGFFEWESTPEPA